MADPEHLKIIKQGVDVWNAWRKENFHIIPNLNYHKFLDAGGNSTGNFKGINLNDAYLVDTNLAGADLREAQLVGADLRIVDLRHSNLSNADLSMADLGLARLYNANLSNVNLYNTNLSTAYLQGANLSEAIFNGTIFGGSILHEVNGLNDVKHSGPSFIDAYTVLISEGKLPVAFLQGVGLPDNFIEYLKSFTNKPIQFYSCFISYSNKDNDFAERLHANLQKKGVRSWFAPKDLKIGDKIRQRIDQSIKIHDKLLLIISENSINSEWCEDECEAAYEEERRRSKTVLFPLRIDDAVMDTDKAWAAKLRRSRNIGDFTKWKDHTAYKKEFDRLLRDLKAER